MEDDGEVNPGSKTFWDAFYSDDGTIRQKQRSLDKLVRRSELATTSPHEQASLLGHYEWFTTFDVYREALCAALQASRLLMTQPSEQDSSSSVNKTLEGRHSLRVLHVGCGSSDFADHIEGAVREVLRKHERSGDVGHSNGGKAARKRHAELSTSQVVVDVVNMDICSTLMGRLKELFPHRTYVVGDCCDMVSSDSSHLSAASRTAETGSASLSRRCWWWCVVEAPPNRRLQVQRESVDLIFDKGTIDALLSGFAGEVNPNASKYAEQSLQLLRDGGALIVISINSESVLTPYFFEAGAHYDDNDNDDDDNVESTGRQRRYFALKSTEVLDVSEQFHHVSSEQEARLRVETLGDRYSVYCFVAHRSDT